jgi:hypothetical protein
MRPTNHTVNGLVGIFVLVMVVAGLPMVVSQARHVQAVIGTMLSEQVIFRM